MTPERVLAFLALVGVVGAVAVVRTVGREQAAQPAPVAPLAPPHAAPATTAPVVSLRTPLPPLPAGLLARAAGARALEREPCPPGAGVEGAADAAEGGRCVERREAVEIRWHVWDEN